MLGLGQSGRMSLSNVLLQSYVDDEYRGRVMSIWTMERSWVSLSAFALGVVASLVGVQVAIGGMATITLTLGAMVFVPRLRKLD